MLRVSATNSDGQSPSRPAARRESAYRRCRLPMLADTATKLLVAEQKGERARRKAIIQNAVDDLIKLENARGKENKYGAIATVIENYKSYGFDFVTRGKLCYYRGLSIPKIVNTAERTNVSSVTFATVQTSTSTESLEMPPTTDEAPTTSPNNEPPAAVRKIKKTKAEKLEEQQKMALATTTAATRLLKARNDAKKMARDCQMASHKKSLTRSKTRASLPKVPLSEKQCCHVSTEIT